MCHRTASCRSRCCALARSTGRLNSTLSAAAGANLVAVLQVGYRPTNINVNCGDWIPIWSVPFIYFACYLVPTGFSLGQGLSSEPFAGFLFIAPRTHSRWLAATCMKECRALESWVAASSNFFFPHPQLRCPYMERDQAGIGSTSSHSDMLCSPMKTQFTWTSIAL